MKNFQEVNQPNKNVSTSDPTRISFHNKQNFFCFLKDKETFPEPRPFFSKNGLRQDIIKVTDAEPDVCLEVFYAFYHVLWPQLERLNEFKKLGIEENRLITSLQDAWTNFIGSSLSKGILWSPEMLMDDPQDVEASFPKKGEKHVFRHLDTVVESILNLKTKLAGYPGEILQREEIMASLELVKEFYLKFRNRIKELVLMILEDKESKKNYQALQNLLEPKAMMMSDIFIQHWAYRIPRKNAQKLLSLDKWRGHMKNFSDEGSTHRVTALPDSEPLVYFKANGRTAIRPEKEFMLYSLYRQLQIPVPETALLILTDVFLENPEYYAVQASEAVIGESALKACQSQETIFEEKAHVSQVIGAFLTNPSDGSFKNFKYSPLYKTLVGIDNDLVFKPEFIEDTVNVKSILYLLPQMDNVILKSTRAFFTSLDPHLTVLLWLQHLSQKNQEYSLLFTRLSFQNTRNIYQSFLPQSEIIPLVDCLEQKVLVDSDLHNDSFYPQILVSENVLSDISKKLQAIKETLENNSSISTQILFEKISPILGKYYQKLRVTFTHFEETLDAVWGSEINGVNYSVINSLLIPEELQDNLPQDKIILNENILPEKFFGEYKNKLASENNQIDQFIQRHSQRKREGSLNFNQALEELRLLMQEGLTNFQSPRDIINFWYSISKIPEAEDHHLVKEITSLLSNLPSAELKWLFTIEKYFSRIETPPLESSSSPVVNGAFMKQRIFNLTESEKSYLFDSKGNIRKNAFLTGRSCVTCFPPKNPEFYLKQYPELPGYEFANILFMRMIGIAHLPYQDLIIINSKYPVLLTERVHGAPVFRVWQHPQAFNNLDPFHTGLLIFSAILLNPEDGKEDNFILSHDGKYLIPIDNDHCFLPSTFQRGKFWKMIVNTALQTKTLLFCLDEMNRPIPLEVKQHVLSIDFDSLLTSWIGELVKVDHRYHHLVGEKQRDLFLKNGTVLRIPFYLQFIHNLYWKVNKIQDLLRSASEQTPLSLLKAVEPFAARCYQGSFQHRYTLESRFKAATDQLYIDSMRGSRISILNTQIMLNIIHLPVKDLLNDVTYHEVWPSDTAEVLKQLIQERSQKRQIEQGLLCELDDKSEEGIWTALFGNPLLETSLINFFLNPKEGLVLKGSKSIVSNKLVALLALTPDQGSKIKFLSLPNSPLLDSKTLRMLVEGCPNLEYLNVNGCVKLGEIVTAKGEWPLLTRLEAKECLNLTRLITSSPIKILRIGTYQKIEILIEKHVLEIFKISTKTNQFEFWLKKGDNFEMRPPKSKKNLSVDYFLQNALLDKKDLFEKYFRNPKITIGMHSILSQEDIGVFITSIDLRTRNIDHETFQKIVQVKLINLTHLQLPRFKEIGTEIFDDLVQGDWPKLSYLNLFDNEISDERLAILSKKNWPLLETLNVDNAKITKKGLLNLVLNPNWFHLKEINFSGVWYPRTKFPNILLQRNWHLLEQLDLSSGHITQSEIEAIVNSCKWPNLKDLNLSSNEITDEGLTILSHGNWPLLEILNLDHTNVTNKGLLNFYSNIKWPNFQSINLPSSIDEYLASSLHQKKSSRMERLDLNNSEITSVEIEAIVNKYQFQQLKYLDLSNSAIFDEGISLLTLANWPLLEELNVQNINITPKGIETIMNQSKWEQLKYLHISDNEIFDEGLLGLALREWPLLEELYINNTGITSLGIEILVKKMKLANLKKLNISGNVILDEGLKILASANWPLFQHLVYYDTKVTLKGNMALLENFQWPNFHQLEHSFTESFFNLDKCSLSEIILAIMPMSFQAESFLVAVLDATWLSSKEIYLSTYHNGWNGKILILPRDKLDKLESIKFSPCPSPIQFIFWPSTLKRLDISNVSLSNEKKLENLFLTKCPRLEDLNLSNTSITTKGIEILIGKMDWSSLKKLCISHNRVFDKGLELLFSENWPLLESLDLRNVRLTADGIQRMISIPEWPNLRTLDISDNEICDTGMEMLSSGKWPLLESLNLNKTSIGKITIESMHNLSKLSNLKIFDISDNEIYDTGLKNLSSGKWPLLEVLNLRKVSMTAQGIRSLSSASNWPNLKLLDLSENFINDAGMKILSFGKWPALENLNLKKIGITADGIENLINISGWPNLKILDLSENHIYDTGLKILSCGKWPLLESLSLKKARITESGIQNMMIISKWPNLKVLHFSNNYIDDKAKLKMLSLQKWPRLGCLEL